MPVRLFCQPPRVKSGNLTGMLPRLTEVSLSGHGADHAVAS